MKFKIIAAAASAEEIEFHGYAAELASLAESVDAAKLKSILCEHAGVDRLEDIPPEKEPAVIAALFEATLGSHPKRKRENVREQARATADLKFAAQFRNALAKRAAKPDALTKKTWSDVAKAAWSRRNGRRT